MKKRRILLFFSCFILIFILLFLTSSFFVLQNIELCFYEKTEELKYVKVKSLDSCNFESFKTQIGKSIFNIKKNNYIKPFEEDNPSFKILNTEIKFPNKLVLNVTKRIETFFITDNKTVFLLDEDYKILKEESFQTFTIGNLIEICGQNLSNSLLNYFNFFELPTSCYYEGYFLEDNNTLIKSIKNFSQILNNNGLNANLFTKVIFIEKENICNLVCKTNSSFGVEIFIQNIENNFNYKFLKVINAFLTLQKQEKIKTTYGILKIDDNFNCYFLENFKY